METLERFVFRYIVMICTLMISMAEWSADPIAQLTIGSSYGGAAITDKLIALGDAYYGGTSGRVQTFEFKGGQWSLTSNKNLVTSAHNGYAYQGHAVALSPSSEFLITGGYANHGGATMWRRDWSKPSSTGWAKVQSFGSAAYGDHYGVCVALSNDWLAIGANMQFAQRVYMYPRNKETRCLVKWK